MIENINNNDENFKSLNCAIQWTTFLHFNKFEWFNIMKFLFEKSLIFDTYIYLIAKVKIFDNVKFVTSIKEWWDFLCK